MKTSKSLSQFHPLTTSKNSFALSPKKPATTLSPFGVVAILMEYMDLGTLHMLLKNNTERKEGPSGLGIAARQSQERPPIMQ